MKLKNEAYDKVENSDLEKLLLNPNNYQTLNDLNWNLDGYKMLTGNSYAYLIKVGSTSELHAIPSPFVDVKVKGTPFDPILKYNVTYLDSEIDGEEMLHFKYWNPITSSEVPANSFKGQSPLQSCRMLLGRYKDADITQGFMFKNMGPTGMITGKTNTADGLTENQATAIQDKFKQQHTGTYKAGEIMVTPSALDWVSFGLSPVDLNILQSKREALSELCNAYNVPIGMFSDTNSTENNMIESRKSMITDAVIPIVEARKMVLNKFLVPKFGEDLVIEYDYSIFHELQDDIEKQANAAVKMYWISPNEKRSMTGFDQDPDPNMNKYYFPTGLETLDNINTDMGQIDEALLNEDI
jgi:HK97 family phage portal protein